MIWRTTLPAAVALALVTLAISAGSAQAQVQQPAQPPSPGQIFTDPGSVITWAFNAALVNVGSSTTNDLANALGSVLGSDGNVINRTPPELSYGSDVVRRLQGLLRGVANVGLAVAAAFGGINLIVNPHTRAPYHGALELVPRLLVGGVLVNTSLDWGRFAIDANNALCAAIGAGLMPGWRTMLDIDAGGVLLNLIAIAIYLVMGLLLVGQMLMRLALVDVLLIVAPIGLLCWILPQTQSWARLWFTTFFGTVFVQFVQVAVLQLGTELMQNLATLLPSVVQNPLEGGQHWLATLLLGVAVLQLARRVPRLMPGYPSIGADSWGPVRAVASRQLVSMLGGSRAGGGQGKGKS
jgi:hypothetical protein